MPITICLPAGEIHTPQNAPERRAFGDPGTTEQFALPNYIYYFVVKKDGDDWKVWHVLKKTAASEQWQKKHYVGLLPTMGDSVYEHTVELRVLLPYPRFDGRVYVIASAVELPLSATIKSGDSLDDLLNLTFSIDGSDDDAGSVKNNLQNIYSTPYNLTFSGAPISGAYYGSFFAQQKVPQLRLLLYHVAAKVDITWNVAEEKRINKDDPSQAVRLTYMAAQHLYDGPCYVFKPMRNELSAKEAEGYSITNIVTATDEGLWWEGRSYFYAIPYVAIDVTSGEKVYFPLQMVLKTNGSASTGYQPTLNMQIDTTAVFVPWLRATFNLSQPLSDETPTKTIDLE